ncbi:MAG TPA: hypothetical protein VH867_00210 [Burkholderiales bacterium]
MTVAIRSAIGNSIGLQVILIAVSVSLRNYPDAAAVSLVALAVYWTAVIGRALQLRDATKVTSSDLHLLRWGYFWTYCLVVLIYRVYLALH